jgi:hypothetical protein
MDWIAQHASQGVVSVLDLGGQNVNGSPRELFPNAVSYTVVDIVGAPGVDIVADAGTWEPLRTYEVVVCSETFEHTVNWPDICATAYKALVHGGLFIVTTAGPGRPLHGANGAGYLVPGEYYANVPGFELERVLTEVGFRDIVVDTRPDPSDTRAVAVK